MKPCALHPPGAAGGVELRVHCCVGRVSSVTLYNEFKKSKNL